MRKRERTIASPQHRAWDGGVVRGCEKVSLERCMVGSVWFGISWSGLSSVSAGVDRILCVFYTKIHL